MLSEFTIGGITFHTYGVIMAVAIATTLKIAEKNLGKNKETNNTFWDASVWMLVGAGIGSRLWHVITDWHLYASAPVESFYIWRGGLSIIGALIGVVVANWLFTKKFAKKISFLQLTDALVLGLPFGQAVGRLGNWVNQELYGSPTNLPWKMFVAEENRLPSFENEAYYHPLFLYEALLMLLIGGGLWQVSRRYEFFKVGSGILTLGYFALYGWVRFFLEFLRVDKAVVSESSLGVNQLLMFVVALVATFLFFKKLYKRKHAET